MPKLWRLNDVSKPDVEDYVFHCPGCGSGHRVRAKGPRPCWEWNGSMDQPTFRPSLLIRWGSPKEHVCHSFITEGRIEFLSDSTHELAGRTVEIPEVEA